MKRLLSLVLYLAATIAFAQSDQRPNIVFIFIDDMGYGDIGPFGNTVNKTPHLDRMAAEGNILRQFYVSNTACTPSRSALITGTYAHRIGMDGRVVFPGETRGLNPEEITIAEMLKPKGYATGCFGKWHLGDQPAFLPLAQGFDEYFGIPYSNDMWPGNKRGNPVTNQGPYTPLPVIRQNEAVAYVSDSADQSLLCEAVTDEAIAFIKKHREKPFFLYLPHAYVHNPRYARKDLFEKAEGNVNRANVEEVDTSVGRVLNTVREMNLDTKTLVIFTSDNGGAGGMSMGPLRGGKGGPKYEGHMREPTIAWWPGTIPPGNVTDEIATTVDILPSLAELAGADLPKNRIIDGKSVLDILLGKDNAKSPHDLHYYEVDGIRRGKWKLVKAAKGKTELYDLDLDLGERRNLASTHPDLVKELSALLAAHADRIAENLRPAGFVKQAQPIISEPGALPTLRAYKGIPDFEVMPAGGPSKQKKKLKPSNKTTTKPSAKPKRKRGPAQRAAFNPAPYHASPDDVLIADFEGNDYGKWTVTGEAFGTQPAVGNVTPKNKVTGYLGRGLVNTFLNGDRTTGTLTSPAFNIGHQYMHVLVGGGNHPGKTCINLVTNGKTVRTATGPAKKDSNHFEIMEWHSWDVTEFSGKEAQIQIVDQYAKGWGHINVDQIYLSNQVIQPVKTQPVSGSELVLADFKNTPLPLDWNVEGYAFGARAAGPWRQQAVKTTANQRQYETGKLISPEFKIERDYIVAEIGGTDHPTKCCVALIVDGKDVRRVSKSPTSMDVREFKGKNARIEVRDNHANGWVELSRIVQSDQSKHPVQDQLPEWIPAAFEKKIDQAYLLLPLDDKNAPIQTVTIEIDGKVKLAADMPLAMGDTEQVQPVYDLSGYQGKILRVAYSKMSGSKTDIQVSSHIPKHKTGADKPAFHVSCRFGKLNDPNGLVYHDGQYHLFHQYYYGVRTKHWSHYVSKDLVHWQERPIGLFPDASGSMHSGSAAVDWFNTSGFQTGDTPPIIAAFTGSRGLGGPDKIQVQGIAYSTDGARTFTKYEGNPVIGMAHLKTLKTDHSRDPKIFRYSPKTGMDPKAKDGHWVMILFEDGNHSIFTSKDLKQWEKHGSVQGFHECPELFPLAVDGDPENIRWVMYGANGEYHIGSFDGNTFKPETSKKIRFYHGNRYYAAQTFSDMPGRPPRRVQVGWQSSQISFAIELSLRTTPLGLRVCSKPVNEISALYTTSKSLDGLQLNANDANPLSAFNKGLYDIELGADVSKAEQIEFNVRGKTIRYDTVTGKLSCDRHAVTLPASNGKLKLRILVDHRSIDLHAGEHGFYYMPMFFGSLPSRALALHIKGGSATFERLRIHELKSIW